MVDNHQIIEGIRAVIERHAGTFTLEDAVKNHTELEKELQPICDKYGVTL